MAKKICSRASTSIQRNRLRDHAPPQRMTAWRSTDKHGTHPANACPADEQDVRPHGTRPNRNAARENETSDRSPHNNLADRTNFFSPDVAHQVYDDPRAAPPMEGWGRFAAPHAAVLASDVTVPGGPPALSRWIDIGVGPSTASSDAPPHGRCRYNSGSERTTAGNDDRSPSADSVATRSDKRVLARSNDLEHPEVGPRELLSRKVKSRIEADDFNPRRLFS